MVAAGRASLDLGAKIAERLGVELTDAGLKTFSDGEVYCRYEDSIRGADLFIVQSTCGSEREGLTVNDALMELLVMVHAAKHASAHRIIAVTPWYGYSRQDKKSAPARADLGAAGRRAARDGGHRPAGHHGPARRPGPGLLLEAGRPHDRHADPHPVTCRTSWPATTW